MFGVFRPKRPQPVVKWDPQKYIKDMYDGYAWTCVWVECVEPIVLLSQETRFIETYADRVDADHWKTIFNDVETFLGLSPSTRPAGDGSEYIATGKYIRQMLEAYERGERFIVAKLAYGGSC